MNTVLLVFAALVAVATAQLLYRPPIVSKYEVRDPAGQFALRYKSADGTVFAEEGALKRTQNDRDNVLVKKGSWRYISPEGLEVKVSYVADEKGFQPISDSIPKPVRPITPQ